VLVRGAVKKGMGGVGCCQGCVWWPAQVGVGGARVWRGHKQGARTEMAGRRQEWQGVTVFREGVGGGGQRLAPGGGGGLVLWFAGCWGEIGGRTGCGGRLRMVPQRVSFGWIAESWGCFFGGVGGFVVPGEEWGMAVGTDELEPPCGSNFSRGWGSGHALREGSLGG